MHLKTQLKNAIKKCIKKCNLKMNFKNTFPILRAAVKLNGKIRLIYVKKGKSQK